MRGYLLGNLSRNPRLSCNLTPSSSPILNFKDNVKYIIENTQKRVFSSENGYTGPSANPASETSVDRPEEKKAATVEDVEDVNNKELKVQIEEYFNNGDEEALPKIFESILKRKLTTKHEETDDDLMDELQLKPLDDVKNADFDSDFDDAHATDEETDDLDHASDVVMKKMTSL